jgi:hypothetical protein
MLLLPEGQRAKTGNAKKSNAFSEMGGELDRKLRNFNSSLRD